MISVAPTPMPFRTVSPPRALPSMQSLSPASSGGTAASMPTPTVSATTLPRLRIPGTSCNCIRGEGQQLLPENLAPAVFNPLGFETVPTIPALQRVSRSPSSPPSFDQQNQPKFGLAHLLQAAKHCQPSSDRDSPSGKRPLRESAAPHQADPMAVPTSHLHSIDYLISGPADEQPRGVKRPRPTLSLDSGVGYHATASASASLPARFELPRAAAQPVSVYQMPNYEATTPVFHDMPLTYTHMTPSGSRDEACRHSEDGSDTKNVWETVLVTGSFPDDICLSENPSCCNKSSTDNGSHPVKQGRWTNGEKEFAENLIQRVRTGEVLLPPNMSLRKFIADSLQCKAMRVSKKFRSLRACQSPGSDGSSEEQRTFNPLSLHSIMNAHEDGMELFVDELEDTGSPRQRGSKTLKRSDYSQHGAVRSGRWSVEEENYAKAMIEAFKCGYLPLHGNVSLRKFLSEVLVCHPMRISKKFVGYVRKYHWYRIAAGKSDPEAKRQALEQLGELEKEFWASMQQNQEWATIQEENRR